MKPQALEWLFSTAAGSPFNISLDNLSGNETINDVEFYHNVRSQAERYLTHGMPRRAETFVQALRIFYGTSDQTLR